MPESPHDVLGLKPGASLEEVKRAYRDKCFELHPDTGGGRPEDFVRVTNAYNYLREISRNGYRQVNWTSAEQSFGAQHFRKAKPKFSAGVVALIIALPLALGGVRAGMAYDRVQNSTYRYNGLLQPPVNPFLTPEEGRRLPVKKRS